MNSKSVVGMTISQLDAAIVRPNGRGVSARTGNIAYLVARGGKRDYASEIISAHRTSHGAIDECGDGMSVWAWDSYMGTAGGFRAI